MYGIIWVIFGLVVGLWASTDATCRKKSGFLTFLLVLLGGPVGLIAWLLFRPEKTY
jgi:uncharacterized membrane protein YeaQ/YmgE (transglycosylase-associated protein family)